MRRVVRLFAIATGFAALLLPAAPAGAAAKPTYVAIVIAGHGVNCVKWQAGLTGDTVLNAFASVSYRRDGVIVQIDGQPATAKADDTHYWSYWHNTGGGWRYSNAGAGGYQPTAGSVEGWAYDNGAQSPPSPPSVSYAAACGSRDPKPAPKRTHRPKPHPAPRTTHHASRAGAPMAAQSGTATAGLRTTTRAHPTKTPVRTSTATASASATASFSASPVSGRGSLTPLAKPKPHDSGGSAGPVLAGVGLVVVIGAGAGWTALRRRRAT